MTDAVRHTTLHDWHVGAGAKMVPFAGYDMPVHYKDGIITEHNHTRTEAGLFDVSHMGHVLLRGKEAIKKFATLVPSDVEGLKPFHMRYTCLLNDWGGVLDDLMMVRPNAGDDLWLIVNASCKENDLKIIQEETGPKGAEAVNRDLIALQGPKAASVLSLLCKAVGEMNFMNVRWTEIAGIPVMLMRSGYTGEDGFEISVEPQHTVNLVSILMENKAVRPIGLGARDTLRLEAGLCLYGHELDEKTTPVEANLSWIIDRTRLAQEDFAGAPILEAELMSKPETRRVGIAIEGRAPARENTEIQTLDGKTIGHVSSGTFAPTLNRPIAMGYVDSAFAAVGTEINLIVRGKPIKASIRPLPFVPHRYAIKKKAA